MRDFGFWVRVIAITQLFCIVLANYGDHWLSADNPLVTVSQARPVVIEAPVQNVRQPDLWSSRSDFSSTPSQDVSEPVSADEWIGADTPGNDFDSAQDSADESDGSLWGGEPQP